MPAALRDNSPATMPSGLEQEFAFSPQDFERVRRLIYEHAGIHLHAGKQAMVYSRLSRRLRETGHRSFSDYLGWLQRAHDDAARSEWQQFVNGLTTNLTAFFREAHHFDCLAQDLRERQGRDLRIWCAACSSGEEPYTIAMTALESMRQPMRLEIVASDISTKVLQIAKFGVYRDQDVRTVPADLMKKYFQKGVGRAEQLFRVKPELRDLVSFRQINLSTPPYAVAGGQDAIFCRNVMIYFNHDLRRKLVHQFEQMLQPQGYLFVGLAESLTGVHPNLKAVEPSVYRKG